MELAAVGGLAGKDSLMARVTYVHNIDRVARMIGESLELIEIISWNSDDLDDGEVIHVLNGIGESLTTIQRRAIDRRTAAPSNTAESPSATTAIGSRSTEYTATHRSSSKVSRPRAAKVIGFQQIGRDQRPLIIRHISCIAQTLPAILPIKSRMFVVHYRKKIPHDAFQSHVTTIGDLP